LHEKGNEVEISCTKDIVEPNVPNQIFTAMNFSNTHFQGTHDKEAKSSTIHINAQHLVSDENKIIYFYAYLTIIIIYYYIVILYFMS